MSDHTEELVDDLEPVGFDPDAMLPTEGDNGEVVEPLKAWVIEDDSAAIWVGRKWAALDREIEAVDDTFRREVERLEQWRDARTRANVRSRDWWAGRLIEYHQGVVARADQQGLKVASSTPYGQTVVGVTNRSPQVVVVDESQAAAWLLRTLDKETRTEVVEPRPKVMVGPMRKRLTVIERAVDDNGEITTRAPGSKKSWPPKGTREIEPAMYLDGVELPSGANQHPGLAVQPRSRTISVKRGK